MYLIADLLLAAAMLFFLFLPITDRRTVMMKIGMIGVIAALFAGSVMNAHGPALSAQLPQSVVISSN
jgi:hypothetical protein